MFNLFKLFKKKETKVLEPEIKHKPFKKAKVDTPKKRKYKKK